MKMIAIAAVLLASGAQADTTRDSVDWDGRYVGVMPCASCPGIDTALTLTGDGRYLLEEEYMDEDDGRYETSGTFEWDDDGSRIALNGKDEDRAFFIGEGMAWMLDGQGEPDEDYALQKMIGFDSPDQQLLAYPDSIEMDAGMVRFDAVLNEYDETDDSYRSRRANFVIDCDMMQADITSVENLDDPVKGDEIPSKTVKDEMVKLDPQGEGVLEQMAANYCDG